MNVARVREVKSFEVYRQFKGRTGITRTLHHDPGSGRTWVTEIREKRNPGRNDLRIETTTDLSDMELDDRQRYELRLRHELDADATPFF